MTASICRCRPQEIDSLLLLVPGVLALGEASHHVGSLITLRPTYWEKPKPRGETLENMTPFGWGGGGETRRERQRLGSTEVPDM